MPSDTFVLEAVAGDLVGDAVNVVGSWHVAFAAEPAVVAVLAGDGDLLKDAEHSAHKVFHEAGGGEQLLKQVGFDFVGLPWEDAEAFDHVAAEHDMTVFYGVVGPLDFGHCRDLVSEP